MSPLTVVTRSAPLPLWPRTLISPLTFLSSRSSFHNSVWIMPLTACRRCMPRTSLIVWSALTVLVCSELLRGTCTIRSLEP